MDVAALAMTLSQVNLGSRVGNAVLSKAMENDETMAQGLVKMIDAASLEKSVNPSIGSNFDIKI